MYLKFLNIMAGASLLPLGYTKVNHIKFTGGNRDNLNSTIYSIKTNIDCDILRSINIDMSFYRLNSGATYNINGFGDGPQIGLNPSGKWHNYSSSNIDANLREIYKTKLIIDNDAKISQLYVNDQFIIASSFTSPSNPFIIGGMIQTGYITNVPYENIYGAQYELVDGRRSSLIPCVRNLDMRAGFFDTLLQEFITTTGSNPVVTWG